jgi:hypothetical protein
MKRFLFFVFFLIFIIAGTAYAGEYSAWGKVTKIKFGQWNTYIHSSVTFPWGQKIIVVDKKNSDHDMIVNMARDTIKEGFDTRFYVSGRWAKRIEYSLESETTTTTTTIQVTTSTTTTTTTTTTIQVTAAGAIPGTGQTKCYNNDSEITCPQPGEAFYGQNAQYSNNPPSYTKLGVDGVELDDTATSWTMVKDNVTGLVWEVKTDDGSIHDKDNTYTWYNSDSSTNGGNAGTVGDGTNNTEAYIQALNNNNYGGFNDWRLPNPRESLSIVNNSRLVPAINTDFFPNTISSYCWSSTTSAESTDSAWLLGFGYGNVTHYNKSNSYYVRAVRGGQNWSLNNFVNNGDGTVTDTNKGLMWQQSSPETGMNWEQALSYCEGLTTGGHNDWRLPTVKELQSIVDYGRYDPAINTDYFLNIRSFDYLYWSSTTYADDTLNTWLLNFISGYVINYDKLSSHYVRAVRGGQN